MSRPPIKAVEQIRNYCLKTQCRRCKYADIQPRNIHDIDYVGCKLQLQNPCDWDLPETEMRGFDE